MEEAESGFAIWEFISDVKSGDIDSFMKRLQAFLADCPYEMAKDIELHYQNVLFIVFRLAGLYTQVEYHTSQGRIDLVLQTHFPGPHRPRTPDTRIRLYHGIQA